MKDDSDRGIVRGSRRDSLGLLLLQSTLARCVSLFLSRINYQSHMLALIAYVMMITRSQSFAMCGITII